MFVCLYFFEVFYNHYSLMIVLLSAFSSYFFKCKIYDKIWTRIPGMMFLIKSLRAPGALGRVTDGIFTISTPKNPRAARFDYITKLPGMIPISRAPGAPGDQLPKIPPSTDSLLIFNAFQENSWKRPRHHLIRPPSPRGVILNVIFGISGLKTHE